MTKKLLMGLQLLLQVGLIIAIFELGQLLQASFSLTIPGSVIGLVILSLLLQMGLLKIRFVESGAKLMNQHLVLFFVPATVGIIEHTNLFHGKGLLLIPIVMLSTLAVMISASLVTAWVDKKVTNK